MKHPTRDRVGAPDPLNQGRIGWPIYEREEHLEITVTHVPGMICYPSTLRQLKINGRGSPLAN